MGFSWPDWLTPKAWRPQELAGASSDAAPAREAPPAGQATPAVPVIAVGEPPDAAAWWHGGIPGDVFRISAAFEAFRATPYQDLAGVWTIGLGSTREASGKPVTAATPRITLDQAEAMARRDLARAEMLVRQAFPMGLPVRWAAVCILLANNMGSLTVKAPTLVRLLTSREWRRAAEQMKEYRNSGGRPVLGLRRRRWAEAAYAQGMGMDVAYGRAWAEIRTVDDWPKLPG